MKRKPPIAEILWQSLPTAAKTAILAVLQSLWDRIATLEKRVRELEKENKKSQKEIDQLKERLGKNSSNSSKPPSTDPHKPKRAPPKKKTGRKRGGQPGHPKHERKLVPPEQCKEVVPCIPETCNDCGAHLSGTDPEPERHQVVDLPPIVPEVTEYQRHELECDQCGAKTKAALPEGVPRGMFGPRLAALLSLLTGAFRLSKRQIQRLCQCLLGVSISTGQICRLEDKTRKILDPVVEEARQHVKEQPANVDETSWVENKKRCWLWVAVTQWVTVFLIAPTRGAKVLKRLVGATPKKVITSDRAKAYDTLPLSKRQLCWAHLRRDFQAMIDRNNKGSPIGEQLLFLADAMLAGWAQVRSGERGRRWFAALVKDFRQDVHVVLTEGLTCGCEKTQATCRELLDREEALWTFARVKGVEPTNNDAERGVRHPVIYRNVHFGTDSDKGSRFLENIFTSVETLRLQDRDVLEFLTECNVADLQGEPLPSLLPQAE